MKEYKKQDLGYKLNYGKVKKDRIVLPSNTDFV